MNEIRQRILDLGEIPTLPSVFHKLMSAIDDDRSAGTDLAEIIRTDPSLTSKLLKLSNSAYYGRFKKVSTVEKAVLTLGFDEIKAVCLGMGVVGQFADRINPEDLHKFWTHALTTAVAVKEIGDRGQECYLDLIYYAGLLHDIGKLVLLLFFQQDYLDMIAMSKNGAPSLDDEKRFFGANHSQTGKWLCERWNFPNELSELITYHHTPSKSSLLRPRSVATVHLADHYAHGHEDKTRTVEHCIRSLKMSLAEYDEIGQKVEAQKPQFEQSFAAMCA